MRCTNVCSGGVATDFAMGRGRTPEMSALEGMMGSEDVAEVVLAHSPPQPPHPRDGLQAVSEPSWG